MVDDGTVNAIVMRRDAPDPRTLRLVEQGKQSVCYPFWLAKLRAGPLWLSNETAPALGEPLPSHTADVHTGLPMTETLGILRDLWFRGPDCIASAHFAVWRHPEAIAATVAHLQKHVRTSLIKITIYSAVASGRVLTSRGAVPSDRELLKLCHGNTGDKSIGGLSRAHFDALRAYRDGWEWSPFMPQLEGSSTRDNLIPVLAYKAVQHFVKSKKNTNVSPATWSQTSRGLVERTCLMATPAWPTPIRELLSKLNSPRPPCSVAGSELPCRWPRAAATRYTTSPRRYFARKLRGGLRCGPDRSRPPRVAPE